MSVNDYRYVYVFVRQDMPVPQQLVHACHAVYHLVRSYDPEEGVPNIVVIGCPDQRTLNRVITKLKLHLIEHFAWDDPDDNDGMLAIATAPLPDVQRQVLSNYRLYSGIAQLREHSVFNGEVAKEAIPLGGNPAPGASS